MKLERSAKKQTKRSHDLILFDESIEVESVSTDLATITISIKRITDGAKDKKDGRQKSEYSGTLELSVDELIKIVSGVSISRTKQLKSLLTKKNPKGIAPASEGA